MDCQDRELKTESRSWVQGRKLRGRRAEKSSKVVMSDGRRKTGWKSLEESERQGVVTDAENLYPVTKSFCVRGMDPLKSTMKIKLGLAFDYSVKYTLMGH